MKSATKHTVAPQLVAAYAADCFKTGVRCADELKDGSFNTAFLVTLDDSVQVVLKIAPPPDVRVMRQEQGLMAVETWAIKLAKQKTEIPLPAVLYESAGDNPFGSPCFFMEKVEGVALSKSAFRMKKAQKAAAQRQVGGIMRQLHDVTGPYFGYPYDRHKKWSDAMLAIINNLAQDALDVKAALAVHPRHIAGLFERYRTELDKVERPAFLHRDLWSGNVLLDRQAGQVTGMVDWERAMYGDPLLDFVFAMVEGLPMTGNRLDFYAGYGRAATFCPEETTRLQLYCLYFYMIMFTERYYRKNGSALFNAYLNHKIKKTARLLEDN